MHMKKVCVCEYISNTSIARKIPQKLIRDNIIYRIANRLYQKLKKTHERAIRSIQDRNDQWACQKKAYTTQIKTSS